MSDVEHTCIGKDGLWSCDRPTKYIVAGDKACGLHLQLIIAMRMRDTKKRWVKVELP